MEQVDVLPLAAPGELQTRITTEKASPKADIFIGGSAEFHDPLGKPKRLSVPGDDDAGIPWGIVSTLAMPAMGLAALGSRKPAGG